MINGDAGWLGWCSTVDRAEDAAAAAEESGADAIVVHSGETLAVVRVAGGVEFGDGLRDHCDGGLYRTATRHVLRHVRTWPLGAPSPGVTMLFCIHRRPGMATDEFHQWWERSHAPIALQHHVGMWDYAQVSVVETVSGAPWDGFAVTQWPTLDDLMHRFSSGPEGTDALRRDAARFTDADTLRRHLLDERVVREAAWPETGEMPVGLARSADLAEWASLPDGDLPRGMSLELRLTSEGRRRADALWRRSVEAGDVAALSAQFDTWWRGAGLPAHPSSDS